MSLKMRVSTIILVFKQKQIVTERRVLKFFIYRISIEGFNNESKS